MISVLSIPKYHSLYNSRVLKVSIQLELIHFHVHNSTMTINFDALEFLICMFSCNNNRISSICVPSLDRKRVCPLSDSRDDDSSFLDSLPSVKRSR